MLNLNQSSSNVSNAHIRTGSNSRLQLLSRASTLNVTLAKQLQQHQQQSGIVAVTAVAGNLSPSILINDSNSVILTSVNNAMAIRRPSTTSIVSTTQVANQQSRQQANSSEVEVSVATTATAAANVSPPDAIAKPPDEMSTSPKKYLCLGDYMFFEPTCSIDTFGSAINTKNKMIYFWKKFERRDYMKKLLPYMVMEGSSDKIYKFSEIIIQSHYMSQQQQQQSTDENDQQKQQQQSNSNENDDVFVLFEPHYGDLHSFMKEKKRLEEPEARLIFRQCVEAVHACHQSGIIIRDIKLKKFVFLDPQRTKIGLASLEDCLLLDEDAENDLIKSQQGCPAYVSPEVLNPIQTSYSGRLSDSWSLGIILYTLLVGRYPFHHPTIANMFAKIARGKFQIPLSVTLSLDARILLRSLIRVKPDERLLPEEILATNWFRHNEAESNSPRMMTMMNAAVSTSSVTSKIAANVHFGSRAILSRVGAVDHDGNDDGCVPQMK